MGLPEPERPYSQGTRDIDICDKQHHPRMTDPFEFRQPEAPDNNKSFETLIVEIKESSVVKTSKAFGRDFMMKPGDENRKDSDHIRQ